MNESSIEQLREGIWCAPIPLPTSDPAAVLAYLIEDSDGSLHVIDTGWDTEAGRIALLAALEALGRRPDEVASVIVTHLHADHLGLAPWLRERTGGRLLLGRVEQELLRRLATTPAPDAAARLIAWGVPEDRRSELLERGGRTSQPFVEADALLEDGDLLPIPGRSMRVMLTPGHTPGHLCLVDGREAIAFTGDHVLPTIFPGLGLGGDDDPLPIENALRSLARLGDSGVDLALPGHGAPFTGLRRRCMEIAEHYLRRAREVAAILGPDSRSSTWDAAARMHWSAGFENLRPRHLRSALAQTEMYAEFVTSDFGAALLEQGVTALFDEPSAVE